MAKVHLFRVTHRLNSTALLSNASLRTTNQIQQRRWASEVTVVAFPSLRRETTSRAMKAYVERAREHEEFMKNQRIEYDIGKRHLANMMGEDPETFTQEDVDNAIEYLFPSGLHSKKARPMMKPPEEVFPARKAAEFDETGRPYHSMFFTGRPNFFKTLYDIAENIEQLNAYEDQMIRKRVEVDPNLKLDLSSSMWLPKEELEDILVEKILDLEYTNFINAMNRLLELPYSYRVRDFIEKFRKPLSIKASTQDIPQPQVDSNGRQFVTISNCPRKMARAEVTVRKPGAGAISINGSDIKYFSSDQCREQVIFPLLFTDTLGKVDVEATVAGGGPSGQAGAIRLGISLALRSFLSPEIVEEMRLAGLLQIDYRTRERKKPGQEGARRKFTWKKR
ncbi:28S ribosomal protein S9, mitochondrial isoform X2 [Lutzomyia longipalpis]|uniref:28S ribosomal protein S9, mitochondrial isoform X2 n=1 Tax=Lutzomyia longipalpis TaxID=7200 RepID=UPI002483C0EB|nr:28S ribosomal protein S9, mitochondrial isoform X2 [Lutzomyia longipalpis]